MPKAEKGTPKDLANRMKSRGLQKLAYYCQVCEKQMRDQNGFKQHCASEPHVRMMLLVGQNPSQAINDYSRQFKHDFLQLLRTAHGEKRVQANHFYQEYIQNKSHIHMNGTHWKTLSEFIKGLGREGVCRVDEGEKGLFVAWIDNSPEALNRQAAIKKKDRQDKGDEERANQLIAEQIERAKADAASKESEDAARTVDMISRNPDQKIKISFGSSFKKQAGPDELAAQPTVSVSIESPTGDLDPSVATGNTGSSNMGFKMKKANVFAQKKSNTLSSGGRQPGTSSSKPPSSSLERQGLSNAQQMILEDQARQRRKDEFQRTRDSAGRRVVS